MDLIIFSVHCLSAGVPAEEIGKQAANELLHNLTHGGCVDDYLQDQVYVIKYKVFAICSNNNGPLDLQLVVYAHLHSGLALIICTDVLQLIISMVLYFIGVSVFSALLLILL